MCVSIITRVIIICESHSTMLCKYYFETLVFNRKGRYSHAPVSVKLKSNKENDEYVPYLENFAVKPLRMGKVLRCQLISVKRSTIGTYSYI